MCEEHSVQVRIALRAWLTKKGADRSQRSGETAVLAGFIGLWTFQSVLSSLLYWFIGSTESLQA
jgi:hypothetical protein